MARVLYFPQKTETVIQILKNLFGPGPKINIEELLSRGAIILDVRTEKEFKSGHVKGSVNIPLDKISDNISRLKKDKPIITCCASGMRSATARHILKNSGFSEVYNGGSWTGIKSKVK
jgi:phage shock protein E